MKTAYVTGGSGTFFPMLCALLQSFATVYKNQEPIWVCDFGWTEGQKKFFEKKGILLKKPIPFPDGWHPWYYKASLIDYLGRVSYDTLTWLDADCILFAPFKQAWEEMINAYPPGQEFVIASESPNNMTLASLIRRNQDRAAPLVKLLQSAQVDTEQLYLNSGMFAVRSQPFLHEWSRHALMVEKHFLFEQNVFNFVAYKQPNLAHKVLPLDQWNTHGPDLNGIVLRMENNEIYASLRGKEVYVAHCTATAEEESLDYKPIVLPVQDRFVVGMFKFPRNQILLNYALHLVNDYVQENFDLLVECNVLFATNPFTIYPRLEDKTVREFIGDHPRV